jgi:hypothetical protein
MMSGADMPGGSARRTLWEVETSWATAASIFAPGWK